MMPHHLDAYLARLAHELTTRGLLDARIVEEARDHLTDAMERGIQRGLSRESAEREAIAGFGAPDAVAATFAADLHDRRLAVPPLAPQGVLLAIAVLVGMTIAYVDSRPTWDDTGITACTMLLAAGLFGLMAPRQPWRWALAIGIWIPLHALEQKRSLGALVMLAVLAFPLMGAYGGMALRRILVMR